MATRTATHMPGGSQIVKGRRLFHVHFPDGRVISTEHEDLARVTAAAPALLAALERIESTEMAGSGIALDLVGQCKRIARDALRAAREA